MTSEEPATTVSPTGAQGRRTRRRAGAEITNRWLARTVVACVFAFALFAGFALIVRASFGNDAEIIGAARLTWNPEIDDALGEGKAASVEIIEEDGDHRVFIYDIEVLRSPAETEFIEVWLVPANESTTAPRVSIGEFDEIRTRVFPIADEIDPRSFERVELSLQNESNRNDYSGRTLLRGELVWLIAPPD
jgi:hypothetical protein